MVTNPGTRDWTVTASTVRHAQRDVRQPHGLRHRPRRLRDARARPQARPPWPGSASAMHVIRELADGPGGRRRAARRCRSRGSPDGAAAGLDGRVRPEGAGADRRGRPTGSSSSSPTPTSPSGWSRRCATAAAAAGRDPDVGHDLRGRARVRRRRPRRTPATSAAGSAGWSATTSPTSSPATASTRRGARGAHRLHQGPRGLRLQPPRPGRATRTPTSCPTRSSTGSACSARPRRSSSGCAELRGAGRGPVRDLRHARRAGGDDRGVRRVGDPGAALTGRVPGRRGAGAGGRGWPTGRMIPRYGCSGL